MLTKARAKIFKNCLRCVLKKIQYLLCVPFGNQPKYVRLHELA